MGRRVVDFFVGTLLVLVYLLLAGLAGNSDPQIEEATAEPGVALSVELVCLTGAGGPNAGTHPSAQPFLVSDHEPRGPIVPRCVAR